MVEEVQTIWYRANIRLLAKAHISVGTPYIDAYHSRSQPPSPHISAIVSTFSRAVRFLLQRVEDALQRQALGTFLCDFLEDALFLKLDLADGGQVRFFRLCRRRGERHVDGYARHEWRVVGWLWEWVLWWLAVDGELLSFLFRVKYASERWGVVMGYHPTDARCTHDACLLL